jgi:primosomal protein N' (replication factor Y)
MDADTTKHKGSHDRLFKEFKSGKADLLIGTQMIAKGLHFPNVTLVGVIGADSTLNIPDFRSNEFVFQLITQVAGRAGRDLLEGEVVIQTYLPNHPVIRLAAEENYIVFFRQEMEERKAFTYPPFSRLIKILFTGKNLPSLERFSYHFHALLSKSLPREHSILLPLTPCGYAKIKDRHRFQCLLKTKNIREATRILKKIPYKKSSSISILYDIDPIHTW